ncbi:hypothetical protein, partial [Limosilactobacillus fermentum]|uniref:hypothetical protein n=1 Tax=Limosilactobacillus fermentum TaxID=1613 RepID=UPI0021A78503
KWERKLKKGGARCKHRPPPKMTHQQDLTKSHKKELSISDSPNARPYENDFYHSFTTVSI